MADDNRIFLAVIEAVSSMNDAQLEIIGRVLNEYTALTFSQCQDIAALMNKAGENGFNKNHRNYYNVKSIAEIYRALSYLQTNLEQSSLNIDLLRRSLPELLEYNELTLTQNFSDEILNKLHYVFNYKDKLEQPLKLLDGFVELNSSVQIVPTFQLNPAENSAEGIGRMSAVIVFQLALDTADNDRSIVFQVSEDELNALEAEIKKARRQLELVKKQFKYNTNSVGKPNF